MNIILTFRCARVGGSTRRQGAVGLDHDLGHGEGVVPAAAVESLVQLPQLLVAAGVHRARGVVAGGARVGGPPPVSLLPASWENDIFRISDNLRNILYKIKYAMALRQRKPICGHPIHRHKKTERHFPIYKSFTKKQINLELTT